jgi:hypothetical protein
MFHGSSAHNIETTDIIPQTLDIETEISYGTEYICLDWIQLIWTVCGVECWMKVSSDIACYTAPTLVYSGVGYRLEPYMHCVMDLPLEEVTPGEKWAKNEAHFTVWKMIWKRLCAILQISWKIAFYRQFQCLQLSVDMCDNSTWHAW